MEGMRQALRNKSKPTNAPAAQPPASQSETTQPPPADKPQPGQAPPAGEQSEETGQPQEQPSAPDKPGEKGGKVSPWKLVEQYKTRLSSMEKEIADLKTSGVAEEAKKKYLTQIEELKKEKDRYEEEIRFLDYTKHPEFKKQYQAPYEAAWKRAISELGEIPVVDPQTGNTRQATGDDLLALVNMPLGKAREIADQVFGTFANDVMQHRKEIRSLFEAQNQALQEAKAKGVQREKQQQELQEKQATEIKDFITENWKKANAEAATDTKVGRFFTPEEGDQEGNQRLAKGFELVDRAWNESPTDPNLTPEQRASVIRRHAAVRNRAAAFGKLVLMLGKLQSERDAIAKELEGYKSSTPPAGGTTTQSTSSAPTSARERIYGELRKLAK